ncbi:DUF1758 domain-containing protein [Trichonephila clavipes]|nr:DUF1758 domain-containing protein [Trichonephila clavipes]
MAWERKRNTETDAKGSRTLEHLMAFLRLEVQGEEMVQLAKSGFGTPIRKRDSPTERVKPTELMTASALASSKKSSGHSTWRGNYNSHSLFGGNKTKPKHHSVFSIEVSDWKRSYACCFEVLSEKKIYGFISKIEDKRILNELKNKEIILSDLNCKETEIGLLIGADNIGKLLTGNLIEFDSGLTAIETKLGWTVIGKAMGRFKYHLTCAGSRIEKCECHYLRHRPVVKLDSATTKIRSVFDASAREKGKPSLNDCLYKGVNLIELIPDILDRFRIYPVGIVADIEKTFLMLSVAPKDRDYLRFFSHAMKNN